MATLFARLWYELVKHTCGLMFRILFGLRVRGADRVPTQGAALLMSNHASHLDPVLVGVASPRKLRFLARDTLFFWPLDWLISSLGAVPINRDVGIAGLRATLRILKEQEALLLFPEGTRSDDGRLQPLKPGFCAVTRRSGAMLVPVGILGSHAALPRGRTFPRMQRIRLQFGQPILPAEFADLSDEELVQLVASRIAATLGEAELTWPGMASAQPVTDNSGSLPN